MQLALLKYHIWARARHNKTATFDRVAKQRYVETAYEIAYDLSIAGRSPQHIVVGSQLIAPKENLSIERIDPLVSDLDAPSISAYDPACRAIQVFPSTVIFHYLCRVAYDIYLQPSHFIDCMNRYPSEISLMSRCIDELVAPCLKGGNPNNTESAFRAVIEIQELLTGGLYNAVERDHLCRLENILFDVASSLVLTSVDINEIDCGRIVTKIRPMLPSTLCEFNDRIRRTLRVDTFEGPSHYDLHRKFREIIVKLIPRDILTSGLLLFPPIDSDNYSSAFYHLIGRFLHNHVSCAIRTVSEEG